MPAAVFSSMVNVTAVLWPGPQLPSIAGYWPTVHKGPTPSLAYSASPREVWLEWNPWNKPSTIERGRMPSIAKWVKTTLGLALGAAALGASASNSSACLRCLCTPVANRQIFVGYNLPDKQDPAHEGNCLRSHTDSLLLIKVVPSPGAGLKLGQQGSAIDTKQLLAPLAYPS